MYKLLGALRFLTTFTVPVLYRVGPQLFCRRREYECGCLLHFLNRNERQQQQQQQEQQRLFLLFLSSVRYLRAATCLCHVFMSTRRFPSYVSRQQQKPIGRRRGLAKNRNHEISNRRERGRQNGETIDREEQSKNLSTREYFCRFPNTGKLSQAAWIFAGSSSSSWWHRSFRPRNGISSPTHKSSSS